VGFSLLGGGFLEAKVPGPFGQMTSLRMRSPSLTNTHSDLTVCFLEAWRGGVRQICR